MDGDPWTLDIPVARADAWERLDRTLRALTDRLTGPDTVPVREQDRAGAVLDADGMPWIPGDRRPLPARAQRLLDAPLPAGARVSVTHDNGTEFAHHERLRDGLGMATYFADPYSSRRRGSNENRNGMIRRYLPKRCEIRTDMAKEVREIVDEINNRPMRVLGYRTPAEAFADELLELQDQQGCCTSK